MKSTSSIRNHISNHLSKKSPIPISPNPLQSLPNYSTSPIFSIPFSPTQFAQKTTNLDLIPNPHNQIFKNFSTRDYYRRKNRKKPQSLSDFPEKLTQFETAKTQLTPRFIAEDLYKVLNLYSDPLVCLELFNYASQQHRFKHDVGTYHIMIKKLGMVKMYEEMDVIVKQVLAVQGVGSEPLFNTMIYFYTEARQLTRAVNVYKHMRKSFDMSCRPSIRTYNLLFTSFLSNRSDTYVNHMFMETIRCLFKRMVDDGVEPDVFTMNSMIKGYILSLHVNDALRIFHQMGVAYSCVPNSHSYNYLIHGLCCQERTNNAKELYVEMRSKGFVPSAKAYNSLVNALAIGGEVEEAVRLLWEMNEQRRSADFITYRTVMDEICRKGSDKGALKLLEELQEKDVVDGLTYKKLLYVIEDEFGDSNIR